MEVLKLMIGPLGENKSREQAVLVPVPMRPDDLDARVAELAEKADAISEGSDGEFGEADVDEGLPEGAFPET